MRSAWCIIFLTHGVVALHIESHLGASKNSGHAVYPAVVVAQMEDWSSRRIGAPQTSNQTVPSCDSTCELSAHGFKQSLSTVPERPLNAKERLQLDNDGFVVIPSLVKNQKLLKQIADDVWKVKGIEGWYVGHPIKDRSEDWSAGSRALAHSDLILSTAASVNQHFPAADLKLAASSVWVYKAVKEHSHPDVYHYDSIHNRPSVNDSARHCQQITVWLVVEGGSRPLEFVRGSHKLREEIEASQCTHWHAPYETIKPTFAQVQATCIVDFMEKHGYPNPQWSMDLKPGDAFIFTGDVLHSGIRQADDRIAVAFKYQTPFSEKCVNEPIDYIPPGFVASTAPLTGPW